MCIFKNYTFRSAAAAPQTVVLRLLEATFVFLHFLHLSVHHAFRPTSPFARYIGVRDVLEESMSSVSRLDSELRRRALAENCASSNSTGDATLCSFPSQ